VRVIPNQITSPDDNDNFVGGYVKSGAVIGVLSGGDMHTMESGRNDLGNLAINAYWYSPIITGGAPFVTRQKQWNRLNIRVGVTGLWDLTVKEYHDRDTGESDSWEMSQAGPDAAIVGTAVVGEFIVSGGGIVRDFSSLRARSEAFQFRLSNAEADEDFIITNANVTYEIGAEVN